MGAWLDVPGDLVASSTIDLILEGILSMELINERKCIFLSQYNDAEKRVCKNLFDLKNTVNSESVANAEAVIKQVEDENSNDLGTPGVGLGALLRNGQLKSLIGTYYT